MTPLLGVDFGTTNSSAVWVDGRGDLHPVPVRDGEYTLPSVVCFHGGGQVLVGEPARQMVMHDPANTIFGIKRFMGRRFFSDYVGRHRGAFSFGLVEGPDGDVAVRIRGKVTPLEEVATHIVARLAELASIAAGHRFERSVVAVPAHFGHRQRRVIRRAVMRAGLKVDAIVNEPTAAALYHASHEDGGDKPETLLVYDLGGGTFDTTVLRVKGRVTEVLATGGEAFLGGADFDNRVADELAHRFEDEHGRSLAGDSVARQRLLFAAEQAKIRLSHLDTAKVIVPCLVTTDEGAFDLRQTLTRRDIETLCAPLVEKTMGITLQVAGNSGVRAEDIDEVVLVGGQTKMPAIQERLRQVTKTGAPRVVGGQGTHLARGAYDADLAVAAGAALFALRKGEMADVVSMPVGLSTPGDGPQQVLPRNAPLPARGRVPVRRPPAGNDLAVVLYESVEETSVDRDVLGTGKVDAAWLAQHPGDVEVEVCVCEDLDLTLMVKVGGAEHALSLVEPTPPPQEAPAEPEVRGQERAERAVGVVLQQGPQTLRASTVNISVGGMFIDRWHGVSVGQQHQCRLDLPVGPVEVLGEIVHVLDGETARTIGQPAGAGIRFLDPLPFQLKLLKAGIDALGGGTPEPAAPAAPSAPADVEDDRTKAFVAAVEAGDLYGALGVEPLATREVLGTVIFRMRQQLKDAGGGEAGHHASRLLDFIAGTLLQPRRRLEHDFRQGLDLASARLAAIGDDEGQRLLLREAWRRMHPDRMDQATVLVAHAVKAKTDGRLEEAIDFLGQAQALDPFDARLQQMVSDWRAGA